MRKRRICCPPCPLWCFLWCDLCSIYDFFQPEFFDGVIVTAEAFMDLSMLEDVFAKIRKAGIPAVIIGGETEGFRSVTSDDETDMQKIAEHLITVHGLTQIHILTGFADMPVSGNIIR